MGLLRISDALSVRRRRRRRRIVHLQKAVNVMARPQMDSIVEGQSSVTPQNCRMEMLRCLNSPTRHRHRTIATQPSTGPALFSTAQDSVNAPSSQQQDGPLRDSTETEERMPCSTESQQPQSDHFPESSSSSADSSRRGSNAEEEPTNEAQVVGRVAIQLRTIGDEINTVYLQRRNEGAQWQNWRGLYRGLVAFLADTISTLYQHRLR